MWTCTSGDDYLVEGFVTSILNAKVQHGVGQRAAHVELHRDVINSLHNNHRQTLQSTHTHNRHLPLTKAQTIITTKRLYCAKCPHIVFGSKCSAICAQAVYFLHSMRPSVTWLSSQWWLAACDAVVASTGRRCQPASDIAENLRRFLVCSVQARGTTLNWFN